eukprot:TRINITY_DN10263_c0_g4_i2.p1 TRINITY_DN10263_c0_g4~~TRINITY_DN10263_c0_g4_i2.p1  ORF type:complete len:413 (+),score=87.71 TRINITY_DN10263_c0_g4_i2:506-1744(+)
MVMWMAGPESTVYSFNIQSEDKPAIEKCYKMIKEGSKRDEVEKTEAQDKPADIVHEEKKEVKPLYQEEIKKPSVQNIQKEELKSTRRFAITSTGTIIAINVLSQFHAKGKLYTADNQSNKNILIDNDCILSIIAIQGSSLNILDKPSRYAIVVDKSDGSFIETEIVEHNRVTITANENYLIWLTEDTKGVYILAFPPESRDNLVKMLRVCKYQSPAKPSAVQKPSYPIAKPYTKNYYSAVPAVQQKSVWSKDCDEEFVEDTGSVILGAEQCVQKAEFSDCVQGMNNNRTFVVMGNNIIIYRSNCEVPDCLEYLATIPIVSKCIPQSPILHDREKSLLMIMQSNAGDSVYRMDLEIGKVVEKYKTNEQIHQLTQVNKNAQITAENNFLGISDFGLCMFDTRAKRPQALYEFHV